MASQVNPPRGMRDFLPVEKARREMLLSVIRRSFRPHGFDAERALRRALRVVQDEVQAAEAGG